MAVDAPFIAYSGNLSPDLRFMTSQPQQMVQYGAISGSYVDDASYDSTVMPNMSVDAPLLPTLAIYRQISAS